MRAVTPALTLERARAQLVYNPETGLLTRVARFHKGQVVPLPGGGRVAQASHLAGYVQMMVEGEMLLGHRLIWFLVTGHWPVEVIDHVDGDRGNNRWANLRSVSQAENCQNMKRCHRDNRSGLLGVELRRTGKFMATICVKGVRKRLGVFDTAEAAHAEYMRAKVSIHPFFQPQIPQ